MALGFDYCRPCKLEAHAPNLQYAGASLNFGVRLGEKRAEGLEKRPKGGKS